MENKLAEQILNKVGQLDERLDNVDKTLIRQEEQLAYHIKRTELLEEGLDITKLEIKPLTLHVAVFTALAKIVAGIGVIAGIIQVFLQVL